MVCKIGGASVWTGDVIEPFVVRAIGERTEIPVPSVLASGSIRSKPGTGHPARSRVGTDPLSRWALYEFRTGENPAPWYARCDRDVRRRIVADAGAMLGRLHAIFRFDRRGGLERVSETSERVGDERERVGSALRVCSPDPPHAMGAVSAWESVCPDSVFELLPDSVSESLSASIPRANASANVLTHGDFYPGNLLVSETGTITTVLDWGNAHVTRGEYAVARAEARFIDRFRLTRDERTRLRKLFRRRYAEYVPLESEYRRRAPLYKGLWLAQSAANVIHIAGSRRGRVQLERQLRTLASSKSR